MELPPDPDAPGPPISDPTHGVQVIIVVQVPSHVDQSEPLLLSSPCLLYSQASFVA